MNNKMKNTTKDLEIVELTNSNGITVKITNFGASIVSILVPDRNGTVGEVVLGYDNPEEYITGNLYFGATIGRFGNRIANGKFTLDDNEFTLVRNIGNNHLHGGNVGFNNVIWEVQDYKNNNDQHFIKLHYLSPDGEEGYPGNLNTWVTYTLTNNNEIVIDYLAETDKKTVINLTHHSFFNLKDGGKSDILDHELMINANFFTPVNNEIITTGELRSVVATPMDFNETTRIDLRIEDDYEQLKLGRGYDHNWVINKDENELSLAAKVIEPQTGRTMEVFTTEPGIQFYSGNFLDGSDIGHHETTYNFRNAFCLETQHFPDSPNQPNFPSTVLEPGEKYTQKTIYKFGIYQ